MVFIIVIYYKGAFMSKKSIFKLTAIISAAVILLLGCVAMFLLIPRSTSKPTIIWDGQESFNLENITSFEKNVGEDFNILTIADTQFDNPFQTVTETKKEIQKMIDYAKPKLILTTGDNYAGIFNHFHVDTFRRMMDSFGLPWATVFGNHEHDFDSDLYYLTKELQKSDLCMLKVGPTNIDGVSNYVLNIKEDGKIVYNLFMMDSNEEIWKYDDEGNEIDNYYDNVRPSQIKWYEDNVNAIKQIAGKTVPSLAFFHVPFYEFDTANALYESGSSESELLHGDHYDWEDGEVTKYNYGFFDKMLELDSTKHVFTGHNHHINSSYLYKGVHLTNVTKTGNFSSFREGKTGGTMITLGSNGKIDFKHLFASNL